MQLRSSLIAIFPYCSMFLLLHIQSSLAISNQAVFLKATAGFVRDGIFHFVCFQQVFHQVIQVSGGFGFTERLSYFSFGECFSFKKICIAISDSTPDATPNVG